MIGILTQKCREKKKIDRLFLHDFRCVPRAWYFSSAIKQVHFFVRIVFWGQEGHVFTSQIEEHQKISGTPLS